jgi:hypothetical protein
MRLMLIGVAVFFALSVKNASSECRVVEYADKNEVVCDEVVEVTKGNTNIKKSEKNDAVFPGYPLIVDIKTIDRRVANWLKDTVVDGQVVALAPGVYASYNPAITDLTKYLNLPNFGDCAMRQIYFTSTSGSCWNGVQKGKSEP